MSHPYRDAAIVDLPVTRLVPPPVRARAVARMVALAFTAFLVAAVLAPWQQNVRGSGRAIAYAPLERQQAIEAPIDGRVRRLYVQEGSHVHAGDPLVELADVDADRLARLGQERALATERVASYESRLVALEDRLAAMRGSQDGAVRAAEARTRVASDRLAAAEQGVAAAEADVDAAVLNLARHRVLVDQGLVSQRDVELAVLAEARARTGRDSARAQRDAARGELESARATLEQARATRSAELEGAIAAIRSAETDLQSARAALLRAETSVARQDSQRIVAPRDGTVLRLSVWQGGEQVRAGDSLLVLVPDTEDRAVELWFDGNDAALIGPGRPVRLQFEGWPAVQFVGWPSVAVGTFGGRVGFVDATDDGSGDFRVVVVPDPNDEPWPAPRYLRQGVRANGWVLLDEVRLGYEVWRQMNGFPPSMRRPPASEGHSTYRAPAYGGAGQGEGETEAEGGYGGAQ